MKWLHRAQPYAFPVLRYGMGLLFFMFAYLQLRDPMNFVGYLPDFIYMRFLDNVGVLTAFVIGNAIAEIILGILLVAGLFVRVVAFLLAVHLLAITVSLGFTMDGIRDFGLTVAMIAIWLNGPDRWSVDTVWKKKE